MFASALLMLAAGTPAPDIGTRAHYKESLRCVFILRTERQVSRNPDAVVEMNKAEKRYIALALEDAKYLKIKSEIIDSDFRYSESSVLNEIGQEKSRIDQLHEISRKVGYCADDLLRKGKSPLR